LSFFEFFFCKVLANIPQELVPPLSSWRHRFAHFLFSRGRRCDPLLFQSCRGFSRRPAALTFFFPVHRESYWPSFPFLFSLGHCYLKSPSWDCPFFFSGGLLSSPETNCLSWAAMISLYGEASRFSPEVLFFFFFYSYTSILRTLSFFVRVASDPGLFPRPVRWRVLRTISPFQFPPFPYPIECDLSILSRGASTLFSISTLLPFFAAILPMKSLFFPPDLRHCCAFLIASFFPLCDMLFLSSGLRDFRGPDDTPKR